MTDRRWETRLLALLAAVLVVFGLTAVYGASSLLTTAGGQVGSEFALRQALGALVGGIIATLLARSNYRRWQRYAWPMLGVAALLLVVVLLPFTHGIAPTINGGRRWVNLGIVTLQPSELAKFAVVVWTAMLAAKKGERIRTFQRGLLPFLVILAPGSAPAEATWQVHQSLVGIGAGRLFGVGLGQGQQKLGYLPYAYSDFIFSTIGEEKM